MTYKEAREYISGLTPRGIQPGLKNIKRLCSELGNPQSALSFVHIAGTNGKGSTGAFLASIMNSAGISAGRFVSPAVGDYLETYTLDGSPVSPELYAECADKVRAAIDLLEKDNIFPTSFEAETAIAFLIFQRLSPGYVLLECGMGGRLDSTNVISMPYLSVITSISLDHKRFLGNTLWEIASEKCGIIKENCPVVTCAQNDEVMEVIDDFAQMKDCPLFIADDIENITVNDSETVFDFEGQSYSISLKGSYQVQNAATAIKAAQVLGISRSAVLQGLKTAQWDYRFECIGKYILDGAHNEGAARELAASMELYLKDKKTSFICGCFRDKDYDTIARLTAPYADTVYCIKPPTERGLEADILRNSFLRYTDNAYSMTSISEAISEAERRGADAIVIFGSLSILKEAKELINGRIEINAKMQ